MTATTDMIKQLDVLNEKVKPASRQKISESQWQKFYDQLTAVFTAATPDERVDIHIAFEDRDVLIESLVQYLSKRIDDTAKLVRRGRRDEALAVLQKGLIADAIIDGRANVDALHKLHNEILASAKQLKLNLDAYLSQIETPVNAYVQRAYQLHKQGERVAAIQSLGRALQLDHTIRRNPKIGELAQMLTGEDPYSAIITLEDSFTRNRFIEESVIQSGKKYGSKRNTAQSGSQLSLMQRLLHGVFPGRRG